MTSEPNLEATPAEAGVTLHVAAEQAGERLDKALAMLAGEISRARLQQVIKEGGVSLNGAIVSDGKRKVAEGDAISLVMPAARPPDPVGQDIPLDVVYEDDHLIVIDKPAGLVVHPAGGHEDGTLVNALIAHCGESLSGIGGVRRPGIVHRLDKDTSGLLVVAKNDRAHQKLAKQFADHGRTGPLQRAYLAIVWGAPRLREGTIDAPIERSSRNREKMTVVKEGRGREAITHITLVERYPPLLKGLDETEPLASLVECRLETGRTHQIRVHMSHIGHPLLGDQLYGSGFTTKASRLPEAAREALTSLGRQALHAAVLGFEHPATGEEMLFESDPPDDFANLQAMLAKL
ncbi:MAG TPA: RluA family pseudouridine synthase [Bosea sp. (in: a-proteobacteria)]|jgi:23S rRNA pseudouridine1911/1915/1917 synthase|uniref:RluA family pseudouridine synthase n=1 Tax=Bosea sp. (in: a-proteobacteria) TaxID=1871050 RepID=UPI002E11352E|nr:RluA family pseudouridine synthase [Bosea sp. (in: a-proteobacteria)]